MKWYKIIFIFFFGLQAVWEITAVAHRHLWRKSCTIGSFKYFLLYNTGDINNAIGLVLILWVIFSLLTPNFIKDNWIVAISTIITTLAFIWIERNDVMDIPFAIIGVLITIPLLLNRRFTFSLLIPK